MAGGHGTRFWPRSRRRLPKQLLPITGPRTLLQETVRRLLPAFPWERMLVVTNRDQGREVRRQLPRLPASHVLVEPMGRNTATCIALAAEWIAAREPDAIMIVVPADHVVDSGAALRRGSQGRVRPRCAHRCAGDFGGQTDTAGDGLRLH